MISRFWKNSKTELMLSFLAFFCSAFFLTYTTDDYGSFTYFSLPAGQFSDYPYVDYYYLGLVGISQLYKPLYNHLPEYNWTGITFVCFSFFSLFLFLKTIKSIVVDKIENSYAVTGIQLFFTLVFIENVIFISHTSFSLIYCGISLCNLAFKKQISRYELVVNSLFFIVGFLIRPESGLGMLVFVAGGNFIYTFNIKHLFYRLYIPGIIASIFLVFVAVDWSTTNEYIRKIEPEVEYKIIDKRMVDMSTLKTAEDSIKYSIARRGMFFDPNILTPEFLRSILLPGVNLSPEHAVNNIVELGDFYAYFFFIIPTFLLLLLLCYAQVIPQKIMQKIFLLGLYTLLFLYMVNYNGHLISYRHFLNVQLISFIIMLHFIESGVGSFFPIRIKRPYILIGLFIVLVSMGKTLANYADRNRNVAQNSRNSEVAMNEIEAVYQNRIIAATVCSFSIFNHNLHVKNRKYIKNKYIMFDLYTYSLEPNYLKYLSKECVCEPTDPVAFFEWLSRNNGLYIADSIRYQLTEDYMAIVHNQKLKFASSDDATITEGTKNTRLFGYDIKKVTIEK
ncbi:MAG: hypothetical protein JNL95_04775 [Chitinophagales bacterium]|nr:hypothetical protein [Chitinophagales bacterium]